MLKSWPFTLGGPDLNMFLDFWGLGSQGFIPPRPPHSLLYSAQHAMYTVGAQISVAHYTFSYKWRLSDAASSIT